MHYTPDMIAEAMDNSDIWNKVSAVAPKYGPSFERIFNLLVRFAKHLGLSEERARQYAKDFAHGIVQGAIGMPEPWAKQYADEMFRGVD